MTYELWSKVSQNIVGAFPTEKAALDAVREAVQTRGRAYAEGFAVLREGRNGRSTLLAEGATLVDRALAVARPQDRVTV